MTDKQQNTSDIIQQIRKQLRLSMNGVVSASMREKGIDYKLNFGVSLPRLKAIAKEYEKDASLAQLLWKENVRELKILAILLYPAGNFTTEQAWLWAKDVCQMEIAEQYCANLLQELPDAETLAFQWIQDSGEFVQTIGFILYARLYTKGITPNLLYAEALLDTACSLFEKETSRPQRAAILALKRYGRMSPANAAQVLTATETYALCNSPEKREIYNDLKFEFDYYQ